MTRRLISPRRWTPPPAPDDAGRSPATGRFAIARRFASGGHGPEDVIFDRQGRVLAGLGDGNIIRLDLTTGTRTVLGNTGGRPLGLQLSSDGSVLVCDHDRGLLRMSADGSVDLLVDTVAGRRLTFASNVVENQDGTIWFTVSTRRWDLEHHLGDIVEHSCTGMLVRRDPDGTVTVLHDSLKFANGLVLAPDASHLLVAESAGYRVSRYWLSGPKAGTFEPFAENLAGLPDNMSLGSDGLVWVAIAAPRNALLDKLLPLPGFLRVLLWNLPEAVRPKPTPVAWVMAFDLSGRLVHDLRTNEGNYGFVTSVAEQRGTVVAGGLYEDDIVVLTHTSASLAGPTPGATDDANGR
ncbi:SMP-30/gluconolactonase/LRE family protein [Streptomyces gibsoniae]|uniref:SMP-30/gluconolactonase/LRE family protein n=1 Tax=Streptomyces gibsoniae TaxID=3075529 RepID=A0ABU2U848_9ACTN|nr:SMP-30/gluconolactonase/LRE family protein [Streptomyces sp. DSM 41699]MDT0469402.1 SMP-30/gluconolactonase/LRE family protein [Streptomyces sp. DSM 41699]